MSAIAFFGNFSFFKFLKIKIKQEDGGKETYAWAKVGTWDRGGQKDVKLIKQGSH